MPLDPRLNAYRPDLADARLAGEVEAEAYVEGHPYTVAAALVGVRSAPRPDAAQITQALMGEVATVFDVAAGWAWCQLRHDGYVGYVPEAALNAGASEASHQVAVPTTFLYPAADLKSAPHTAVHMNTPLHVVEQGTPWSRIADGRYVFTRHLRAAGEHAAEPAAVAVRFENVPYLWGGRTQQGLDCSGLIQTAFHAAGRACPRDTDMIARDIGTALPFGDPGILARGDLVFWTGHVGMMLDSERLIHANGYHMLTAIEPVAQALERIATLFGPAKAFRRP